MTAILPPLLDLGAVRALYAQGHDPRELFDQLYRRAEAADPAIFITRTTADGLATAVEELLLRAPVPNSLPLWGIPVAVKDNIDVAGLPTTCACPELLRLPDAHAAVVSKLVAAGAIVVGKTNLDQFATGLNGTRSPYGAPRSVFDRSHISGGSSSGSAVAVAAGLASFALGTDTAGSGRVPAALNNIVGIKPTPGLLSMRGLVPACESLDCVTIFALSTADGTKVRRLAEGYDPADPWSRIAKPRRLPTEGLKIGVLREADRQFFGCDDNAELYARAIANLGEEVVEIDYAPFAAVAALLYEDAWVAERQAAFKSFGVSPDALDPAVRAIFAQSSRFSAVDAFAGLHKLEALRRECSNEMAEVDALLLPTTPRSFTVESMLADPVARNAQLGIYTNFCNFLGMAAVAVPAGIAPDGIPFGVMLVGPAYSDEALAPLADRLHRAAQCGCATDLAVTAPALPSSLTKDDSVELAVVGAHLSGMPLNHELVALGAELVRRARTSTDYRLFVLPDTVPPKPGLVHDLTCDGPGIEIEVWSLPVAAFGKFVAAIPAPLGIGKVTLAGGSQVSGFLCETWATERAEEITRLGGWRRYCGMASNGPVKAKAPIG